MSAGRAVLLLLLLAAPMLADQGGREGTPPSMPEATGKLYRFPIAPEDYLVISSPFGWRISPTLKILAYHTGLDIATVHRAQIVAVDDGVVIEPWPPPNGYYRGHPTYGGMVRIRLRNGIVALYGHLSALYVTIGQEVKAGQVIGRAGATGKVKGTGSHLHFELQIGDMVLNPALYISLPDAKG